MTGATDMIDIDVMAPRTTDDEASALLDELSKLQLWCLLQKDEDAIGAADLIQRTRILVIERCKRGRAITITGEKEA